GSEGGWAHSAGPTAKAASIKVVLFIAIARVARLVAAFKMASRLENASEVSRYSSFPAPEWTTDDTREVRFASIPRRPSPVVAAPVREYPGTAGVFPVSPLGRRTRMLKLTVAVAAIAFASTAGAGGWRSLRIDASGEESF